ncbi:MAG: type II toxin-antitoxin system VapC family toxin [Rubrivivax sp.]|nr:type II toxin-antitoxin system VapC family toxin [Rubrivivax sp.]
MLLDTHALVWLVVGDGRLRLAVRRCIEAAAQEQQLWVSAITPWEIGMLVAKGRLVLDRDVMDWLQAALALPGIRVAPLEPAVAVASTRLPGELHGDPADRLIVATARHLGAALVTADAALLAYGQLGHVGVLSAR